MIWVGTSGYSYPQWKDRFYPKGLPATKMLAHYASKLPTVEINNTFYKRPTKEQLGAWATQTPSSFRFAFKASRYFSAGTGLRDDKAVADFYALLAHVGPRLGPVLVQLPNHIEKDVALLARFLDGAGTHRTATALDLVHPSWRGDDVDALLRERDVALCVTEEDDSPLSWRTTARWAYVRLRKKRYAARALSAWATRLLAEVEGDAYVFFKHEDDAPKHALSLLRYVGKGSSTIS